MNNLPDLDRELCENLLREYTKSESLLLHAFSVEACVAAYATKFNKDPLYWGNVAMLHDFDYEMYPSPEEHPYKGAEILRAKGFSEDFIDSIMSHTPYTGVPRTTLLRKVLFACDELAGFITAVSYVMPDKKVDQVEARSVLKKMKDKAFARSVSREDIRGGAEILEIPLEEHIGFCIQALRQLHTKLAPNPEKY
ncbi:MAG: HDIG domain-containing protein [Ignavibacteriaceae bacterium]|nr:HDIG domain-containing protein [Ignavibacteriaceae bacterium]